MEIWGLNPAKVLSMKRKGENMFSDTTMISSKYFAEKEILNLLPVGIAVYDSSGFLVNFNPKAAELWGRGPDTGEMLEKFFQPSRLYTIDGTVLHNKNLVTTCIAEGSSDRLKLVMERADLSRVFVEMNIAPLFSEEHSLIGVITCFSEINIPEEISRKNGRDRLIEVLQGAENHFSQLFENIQTPVYTTDIEGKITFYNKAATDLWGQEPDVNSLRWCGCVSTHSIDGDLISPDQLPIAACTRQAKYISEQELIIERPDGSNRTIISYPSLLFDGTGNISGAINLVIDITNRTNVERALMADVKKSNQVLQEMELKYRVLSESADQISNEKKLTTKHTTEELKQSEEQYHKMIEEIEDYAIILLDKEGIIQNWNKGAEKIKGYREEEILGKSFSVFYRMSDREEKLPNQLLQRAREKGKAIHEGWRVRKDGSQFWGSIVLTALHDDANNVIGFSKVTRDLTERKLAEDKAREYSNELEFQNKELEQFAYAASHDLKEPLRKIHFYNYSISENDANILDDKSREYLNRSINAVKRMTELIEDLLMYSRTTSHVDSFQEVDLNEMIDEIGLNHKEDFEQKKIVIQSQSLPIIYGVPFQFKQLLTNLVSNSMKYRHTERQLAIKIIYEDLVKGRDTKERNLEPDEEYHHISISDNGIGFEAQYSEKIFEIFQRLSNHSGTRGSGIGLAICKKIVQNHGGVIRAYGKVNEGARFDIYLPVEKRLV